MINTTKQTIKRTTTIATKALAECCNCAQLEVAELFALEYRHAVV
jgi:hypothetical protein